MLIGPPPSVLSYTAPIFIYDKPVISTACYLTNFNRMILHPHAGCLHGVLVLDIVFKLETQFNSMA